MLDILIGNGLVLALHSMACVAGFIAGSSLLLVAFLPHAVPELVALFLPLAAWLLASRTGDWHELLAATLVTTALAAPRLVLAAFVEVYVSPSWRRWPPR